MKTIKNYDKRQDSSFINIMEFNGFAFSRGYYFHDDKRTFYMDQLTVNENHRRKGFGLKMQELREHIARDMGFKYTMLWVVKGIWMRKWYERRGYKYHSQHKKYNAVWLRKKL